MNNITIEDIGIKKEIELAAHITADHYKRLIAVLFIDSNDVHYKVVVDGDNNRKRYNYFVSISFPQ